jgi:hypothetical protein
MNLPVLNVIQSLTWQVALTEHIFKLIMKKYEELLSTEVIGVVVSYKRQVNYINEDL